MSYPFGSGMPPLPNSNMNSLPYPGQPNRAMPMPNQPPFGAGFMAPSSTPMGYPPSQYPSVPSSTTAYPQQTYPPNPSYPAHSQQAYPPNSSYPQQTYSPNPSYPAYPSNQTYGNQSTYGNQTNSQHFPPQQGYTGNGFQQVSSSSSGPAYPVIKNLPNHFEMQGHIKDRQRPQGRPTVVPAQNFDPVADSQKLRKAMKGFGTDEDAIIDVICRRSNEQRQIIARTFKTHFGKDLIDDIRSETSGNFENLLVALITPIVDFYVKELHDAMAGIGTDEDVLIEILCTMSNYEIQTIKHSYERLYGKSLESELISETSGNFKRLLVSLCAGGRDESGVVDHDAANRDATELLRAGELRAGTDESTFNMVFCQRNFAQIKLICEKYQQMTGHGLDKAIRKEFSGDICDGLLAILQCTTNKAEFFASRLHKSMAGMGTNDKQLIRLIVTRCEIDLHDIKVTFERVYGKSLRSWVKGDTSGHYKHALYTLIGEERSS